MDEKEIEALARRMAWRYAKSRDPQHSDTYTFNRYCLLQFAGSLPAAAPAPSPLTDEQLRDALRQCPHDTVENLRVRWLYAKDFARAIERAHGIGTDAAPTVKDSLTPAAPQWQPIETAPRDGTAILLGSRGGSWIGKWLPVYASGYRPDNPWSSLMLNHDHMGEKWCKPTHWMPLPAAPDAARAQAQKGS